MKRIQFNSEVEEIEAPDLVQSFGSRTADDLGEVEMPASPPARESKKRAGFTTSFATQRNSLDSTSAGGKAQAAKRHKSNNNASSVRVVTGFRGAIIPEYKGRMPRVGHISFVYQRNFYIFGGINAKGQYSSYIFCHEKRSLQWEEVRSVGLIPSGRANLSAIQYDNKLVIYGGNRQLDVFDDLYSYDLDANRWEKIGYERSQGPGPVFLHTAVYVPLISTMVVLGGFHQREHNMYLGHAFDLRNRIWSGLPGPRAINPQHIQLVAASYYDPKQSIVVVGLVERDIRESKTMPPPSVYMMNVHSWVWTKVSTAASPESPIPFHMDIVWDHFTRQLVTMGGFYEEVQQTWYFPLNLEPIEQSVVARANDSAAAAVGARATIFGTGASTPPLGSSAPLSGAAGGGSGSRHRSRPRYGFFKLSMQDMMWSIVPINLPRRFGETAPRASIGASSSLTRAVRRSTKDAGVAVARVQKQVLGDLNLDGVDEPTLTGGQRVDSAGSGGRRTITGLSPSDLTAGGANASAQRSSTSANNAVTDTTAQQQQEALLFTVRGEPQFQRKYAYAAYRDPQTTGKRKPMQYIIMHGGLETDESSYALLMFTPFMSRTDALTSQRTTTYGENRAVSAVDMDDSASFSASIPDVSRSFETEYSMPFDDVDPVVALAERERRVQEERQECLLPVLPCARTAANSDRFAVLYHSNNSMQSNRALPYAGTPAAVLERPEDVMQWSSAFYRDKRKWLADQLKQSVAEDRRLRRGARRHGGSKVGRLGSAATAGGGDDDDDDDDLDPRGVLENGTGSRPNSANSRHGSSTSVATRASASLASAFERSASHLFDGDQDSVRERSTAGETDKSAAGPLSNLHTDDFFKAKGLEPFMVEKTVFGNNHVPRTSESQEIENPFLAQGAAQEVIPAGLERLWMKVKRHGEQQRLPAAVFRGAGTVNDGTMTGDLGSAMAFLLLRNAVAMLPVDDSPEKCSRRAQLRWRFLRALVKTGEAAFIIYRANQRDARTKGQVVTSYPGLVMAPELHLIGATRAHKVPTRPVPYTVTRPAAKKAQYAEVTKSGMVAYHNIRHVK